MNKEQMLKEYLAIDHHMSKMPEAQIRELVAEFEKEAGMQNDLTHYWNPRERAKYIYTKMARKEMKG